MEKRLEHLETRVGRVEDQLVEISTTLSELVGLNRVNLQHLESLEEVIHKRDNGTTATQRLILGAIVAQGILQGVLTPDTAKALITGVIGG